VKAFTQPICLISIVSRAENRLIKVESRSDTPQASWRRVEWQYDALGRRIRQITSDGSSGNWVVTEDLKFVSDPMLFGRHIAELRASDNALVRSYSWGLDLSGTMEGAGGVGGLLWVSNFQPPISTHFVAYDGNGNVVALVSATSGSETARYEYGPFGEPIRVTGPAANLNPFRFSTKRTCNATDLVLYEYRAYNPTIGRWLSRDPADSSHEFAFVDNASVSSIDIFGLWGDDVHRDRTAAWASALGIQPQAAHKIGYYDAFVDKEFASTAHFTEQVWSWHFDRSQTGDDSRIIHARESLAKAKWWCTWNEVVHNDDWEQAARELGRMLHPLQDWIAHGDFNRWTETPNMPRAKWWQKLLYAHNILSPVRGQGHKTPDKPEYDAVGMLGRPTLANMTLAKELDYGGSKDRLHWAWFFHGSQRINATEALTKIWLGEFQEYVRQNSLYCGTCWLNFVP